MAKRIILSCFGSYGDLFPYLAIGARLKALGHTPVVATSMFYRDLVEREGLLFHPVRPDIDPSDAALMARVMDASHGSEAIIRELVAPFVRDAFVDLSEAVKGADLLVTHPIAFAGPLVAEARRLPWLSTVLAPTSMLSIHDFPILTPFPSLVRLVRVGPWAARALLRIAYRITAPWTAPVRAFRHELGLGDGPDALYRGQFSPHGTLAVFSPVLGMPQPDWPDKTTLTGFVFYDRDTELPPALVTFLDAGPPPIVFTLGTSAVGAAGSFYEESVEAVIRLGRRAVMLIGRDPRNRPSRPLPPEIIAVEYAPHRPLFSRAAAVVHHGGAGTTGQALRAKTPMLVVPHAHDQLDNAFRLRKLGVARVLNPRRYTRRRAAAALDALLSDPSYAARATAAGEVVGAERGADTAADTILRVAGD